MTSADQPPPAKIAPDTVGPVKIGRRFAIWLLSTVTVALALAVLARGATTETGETWPSLTWTTCAALAATVAGARWTSSLPRTIGLVFAALTTLIGVVHIATFANMAYAQAFTPESAGRVTTQMQVVTMAVTVLIPLVWTRSRWAWVIALAAAVVPLTFTSIVVVGTDDLQILPAFAPLAILLQVAVLALRITRPRPNLWFLLGIVMVVPVFWVGTSLYNTWVGGPDTSYNDDGASIILSMLAALIVLIGTHVWWLIEDSQAPSKASQD